MTRSTLLATMLLAACSTPRQREAPPPGGFPATDKRPGPPPAPPEGSLFPVYPPPPAALGESTPVDTARMAGLFAEIELSRVRGDAAALYERYIDESNAAIALAPDAPGTRLSNLPRSATEARLLAALATNDEDEAWKLCKLVQDSDAQYGLVHVAMGILYERWKILHQARQAYERALRMLPQNSFARLGLARIARANGSTMAARAALEGLVAEAPDYAEAHYELGTLLMELKEPKAARGRLETAVALESGHFRALKALAEVRLELGANDSAIAAFREAVAIHPADRAMQLRLAGLLLGKGDLRGAALSYEAGMPEAAPDAALLRTVVGLYARLDDAEKEVAMLGKLVKLDPKDGEAWRRVAALRTAANAYVFLVISIFRSFPA